MGRNPRYENFDGIGGDCTNFVSQCLFAGAGVMNDNYPYGWFYESIWNRSPSWTGVEYFYDFMVRRQTTPGPFGVQANMSMLLPGDFVQLKLTEDRFSHTPIIVEINGLPTPENILIAAHSFDSDYRPLSTYDFQELLFIHIVAAYGTN